MEGPSLGWPMGDVRPAGSRVGIAGPSQASEWTLLLPVAWAESRDRGGERLLTLVTFLLMFSRSCSWPRRKHGCWNSVSSLSGLTRPPCSMWTTFRKPSVYNGVGAALPQGWGLTPLSRKALAPGRMEGSPGGWGLPQGMPSTALPEALPAVAGWS